ncbi:Tn3 family transposase [Streptomyces sp. BE147]|nr:Tn3 family transposase [Streptomyces sp. BE147]MEE1735575.1 Tn3 family transposase [Streptomyces sp. BE147]
MHPGDAVCLQPLLNWKNSNGYCGPTGDEGLNRACPCGVPFATLAADAIVLWTTKDIDAAIAQLQAEGHEIREKDIARLSPLKHRNLNLLGRYSFTAQVPDAGALRPPREPDAPQPG